MAGKVEIKILKIRLVHMLHPTLRFLDPAEGPEISVRSCPVMTSNFMICKEVQNYLKNGHNL